ncbi:hypothetical protein ACH5RR_041729 [Cinchona calisaya]|uniref:Uncharacterized protein n=1 Tax=Cinchona calisaya TaxID=153742 RepID=A0ABD2XXK7_9GENT
MTMYYKRERGWVTEDWIRDKRGKNRFGLDMGTCIGYKMATKALTNEAIALTEKKMDMTLDDIIKMSKNNTTKGKKQRVPNKNKKSVNDAAQYQAARRQKYFHTVSTMRQGALAQRRSNFQGNWTPSIDIARKDTAVHMRSNFNRIRAVNVKNERGGASRVQRRTVSGSGFNVKRSQQQVKVPPKQRPQTLDSLFADMKEQRTKVLSQYNNPPRRNGGGQQLPPWQRGAPNSRLSKNFFLRGSPSHLCCGEAPLLSPSLALVILFGWTGWKEVS